MSQSEETDTIDIEEADTIDDGNPRARDQGRSGSRAKGKQKLNEGMPQETKFSKVESKEDLESSEGESNREDEVNVHLERNLP